jgi:hypothetical protein
LEDDYPAAAPAGGTGRRYALGLAPTTEQRKPEGELPEAYGTEQLLLAARDPHWLYAHWDLTREQQLRYNAQSADRHLVLRVYLDRIEGQPVTEVHIHPESRHWFIHVARAGTKYVSELGYYSRDGRWRTISISAAARTPPDRVSADTSVTFATIPYEVPGMRSASPAPGSIGAHRFLAGALEEWRAQGEYPWLYSLVPSLHGPWTPAQEQALAEVISLDTVRHFGLGSFEITELIRRQLAQEFASLSAAQAGAAGPSSQGLGAVSSPPGEAPAEKGFWFNVNADLIVYGATERNATVTVGGRIVKLQPDGSFSCRFALPDGQYELPVVAVSADLTDGRAAELKFSRSTEVRGDVGTQPPDPALGTPEPATD